MWSAECLRWRLEVTCMLVLSCAARVATGSLQSKRLYDDLFVTSGYNKLIRPAPSMNDTIYVKIGLQLMQIIDVDEKNQIMTTNVWVLQEWWDPTLSWSPHDYDGVDVLYVPAESIWHPDIVLYNTLAPVNALSAPWISIIPTRADGNYEMARGTKATLKPNGRSTCSIDVTYFPFDEQECSMKFGSWTYNKAEVEISHMWLLNRKTKHEREFTTDDELAIDMKGFYPNVEWDVMGAGASKSYHHYAGEVHLFPAWTFNVTLRRQFLFYTVNLIIPLVSHSCVTLLVFYLPADSRQKIALCINILLSLTVFFLMLAEIIPPTSLVTMTVFTYNIHYRSVGTHTMPNWVRKIFLYYLPRLLRMRRPKIENSQDVQLQYIKLDWFSCCKIGKTNHTGNNGFNSNFDTVNRKVHSRTRSQMELLAMSNQRTIDCDDLPNDLELAPEVKSAISGATYVVQHLKHEDECNRVREDWKYIAMVFDRIFLIIYTIVCFAGTTGIICSAPMLYDTRSPLRYGL